MIASCTYNLALDLVIYILPMPTLWKVEIPLRQRVVLIGIFAMGGLVVISGIFRIYWVWVVTVKTWDTTCKTGFSQPFSLTDESREWLHGLDVDSYRSQPWYHLCHITYAAASRFAIPRPQIDV